MLKKWQWISILTTVIVIAILFVTFHHPYVEVYDNFETPKLSSIWGTSRMTDSSLTIQSTIIRNGKSAAKITLHNGDIVEAKTDKDNASERDELMEAMSFFSIEGKTYQYKFSLFLPDSFPILPIRLVIAQWKEFCPKCSCSEYSPILALRYVSGKFFITLQVDSTRKNLYELTQEIRNNWNDFIFQIKFSKEKDGMIKASLNNEKIIDYTGITSYQNNCRILSDKNKYYFKMGLYRDRAPQPMSIYIDNYSKKQLD